MRSKYRQQSAEQQRCQTGTFKEIAVSKLKCPALLSYQPKQPYWCTIYVLPQQFVLLPGVLLHQLSSVRVMNSCSPFHYGCFLELHPYRPTKGESQPVSRQNAVLIRKLSPWLLLQLHTNGAV